MDHRNLLVGDELPLSLEGQLRGGVSGTWPLPAASWSSSAPWVCSVSAEIGDTITVRALAPGNCVITVTHAKEREDVVMKEEDVWRAEGAVHHAVPWSKSPDWIERRTYPALERKVISESRSLAITVSARADVPIPEVLILSVGERKAGSS